MENSSIKIPDEVYEKLPQIFKDLTEIVDGKRKDILLLSSIVTLGVCLPKVYGYYDSEKVYPNLYFVILGPAGIGKSIILVCKEIIEAVEKQEIEDSCFNRPISDNPESHKPIEKEIFANSSSSSFYDSISLADNGGIIIDSEADTLSIALKQEWGDFSSALRCAFHHEDISKARKKDNERVKIKGPKLSLLLSGTPEQLMHLIQSKENGLYSRLMFFSLKNRNKFRNVFEKKESNKLLFREIAKKVIVPKYLSLRNRKDEIEFSFTEEQINRFMNVLTTQDDKIGDAYPLGFDSVVKRHGLMLFRICLILSLYRDDIQINEGTKIIYCNNNELDIAIIIFEALIGQSYEVYKSLSDFFIPENEEKLLFSLEKKFTRGQLIEKGTQIGFPERTLDEKIKIWRHIKAIKKLSHGHYERILS